MIPETWGVEIATTSGVEMAWLWCSPGYQQKAQLEKQKKHVLFSWRGVLLESWLLKLLGAGSWCSVLAGPVLHDSNAIHI